MMTYQNGQAPDRPAAQQLDTEKSQLTDLAGGAIPGAVSEEVDSIIRDQIKWGSFPVRLQADDWQSGKINWLLDGSPRAATGLRRRADAPNQKTTADVIANFKQVVKDGDLRLHPIVSRLVDAETLEKMGASKIGGGDVK